MLMILFFFSQKNLFLVREIRKGVGGWVVGGAKEGYIIIYTYGDLKSK